MKLTLDIPDEHAPRLLALLADLMTVRLEPQTDPAEGHPELPMPMPVAEWAEKQIVECSVQAGKTAMVLKQIESVTSYENSIKPYLDGEMELPFPEDFPTLPPLPKGKSRWVYRGKFGHVNSYCRNKNDKNDARYIMWWDEMKWYTTTGFSLSVHHIEAL